MEYLLTLAGLTMCAWDVCIVLAFLERKSLGILRNLSLSSLQIAATERLPG